MFRITLFPSSRLGRLIYMVGAIIAAFAFASAAVRDARLEKAFANHGVLADVLAPDHYTQHSSRSSSTNITRETYKTADLSFRTSDDQRYTRTMQLEESEFQTLRNGGTLHMQYLPEDPQGSARLEGHARETWMGWVFAVLFGCYAFALKP